MLLVLAGNGNLSTSGGCLKILISFCWDNRIGSRTEMENRKPFRERRTLAVLAKLLASSLEHQQCDDAGLSSLNLNESLKIGGKTKCQIHFKKNFVDRNKDNSIMSFLSVGTSNKQQATSNNPPRAASKKEHYFLCGNKQPQTNCLTH